MKFEPRFYDSKLNMGTPVTGPDLAQALYASQWLAPTIPPLAELVSPLRKLLRRIQTARGSLKNKALVGTKLVDFGWDETLDAAWKRFLIAIRQAAELATYPDLELCLFTDASDTHFAGVVTQCPVGELDKPHED